MIKIRGNTAFQAIRGETFEKAVQINCLDTITKVTFQVPSLSINKELSLMNDVFYLRLESDETKDLTVGTFLYSLTIHFFSNGVRTVLYNKTLEVIDIALPPSENEPCPYDDYDITETYNVFSKTVDLTINLLDVIRVMSERFLFVDNLSEALKSYKLPFLAHVIQGEESYHFMVSLMDGIPTQYLISGNLLNEFILVKIRRFINDEWTSWEGRRALSKEEFEACIATPEDVEAILYS